MKCVMVKDRQSWLFFFFFKQKTAYEIYQCDWSSDVCSSDLVEHGLAVPEGKVATTPEEAESIAAEIGGMVVVKADRKSVV